MPDLTVIYWREIPAQVMAIAGGRSARLELSDRFLQAIDAAAMKAGLSDSDAYLEEWRRETRPCSDDLDREVTEQAASLEEEFTADELKRLIGSGGRRDPGPGPT